MTARFLVRRDATPEEIAASPLGRVITEAHRSDALVVYGDGYPAHNGGWWQPLSWNPAKVRVAGERAGVRS